MEQIQSSCLRVVTGAYKATAIRHLESEASCPLLDLYLNKRLADFEARLRETGKDHLLRRYCEDTAAFLRWTGRLRPFRPDSELPATSGRLKAEWATTWTGADTPDEAVLREWQRRSDDEATHHRWDRDPEVADFPNLGPEQYKLYLGLHKAESSMLM